MTRADCHARSLGMAERGCASAPSTWSFHIEFPEQSTPHSLSFFFFFNIYETHYKVYTNKPRALLMQQALYNEPKRARLLWEDGMSVQTLGVFHFKNKVSAPFHHSPWICTCPNHPSHILNRQCTQVHLTIPGQPLW